VAQLDAERALLDDARSALGQGDAARALGVLERHERQYPHPLLGEERDALLVQALVRAGRYTEARSRADAFRRRAPNSLLLPAVDAAIGSIP
jgi:outer membrane protein assembly factor BamD (BamD/ComL family)